MYKQAMSLPLILASASPQRKTLLEGMGIPFEVHPSSVDEDAHPESVPHMRSRVLAELKAKDVAGQFPGRWVLGSDTLVEAAGGLLLEKPRDADDARRMLQLLGGNAIAVHSGVAVHTPQGDVLSDVHTARVHFRPFTNDDIHWWIETGLWEGRSGSFQLEGVEERLVDRVEGERTGVIGLPVLLTRDLLTRAGF